MTSTPDLRVTVRSYELDIMGHVNNAVYLQWLEQARLQVLESLGYPLEALIRRRWVTTVARIEIDYRREARFGDEIRISTEAERVGRTSLTLRHRLERGEETGDLVAEARVVLVWLGADGQPASVPDEIRAALARRASAGGSERSPRAAGEPAASRRVDRP